MIVLDVETTGTEASLHSLASIGAVDFNDPSRTFFGECRIWEGAHIMKEALAVNGYTEEQLRDPKKKTDLELVQEFFVWAEQASDHTIMGMNPFFDIEFVKWTCVRHHINFMFGYRSIDMHTACYIHMIQRGLIPPIAKKRTDINSDFVTSYVGIPNEPKPHVALNGALWEAEAFSRLINNKKLLPQFSAYAIPWLDA